MAGLARLGLEMGHTVGGCDIAAWPPMSDQLNDMGINMDIGWEPADLAGWDQIIVGNALSRGNPLVETMLDQSLPFISGPQWLFEQVLKKRTVLAIAGTHGKTTTTSMLAWILQQADLQPGFLLGGQAQNFGVTARLGDKQAPFVIEADEYDSAFFDKRPKFLHYYPHIALLNNLEFDHADIYADIEAIKKQFHYLLRSVPPQGRIIYRGNDSVLREVIDQGVWSPTETFAVSKGVDSADWVACMIADDTAFEVYHQGKKQGRCRWSILGRHNVENALAALACAFHVGVAPVDALRALETFKGVRRRLEVKANSNGIVVYDDFAHHPTAIAATLEAIRHSARPQRIIAVFEPASNTMKLGVHKAQLAQAFAEADVVFGYQTPTLQWSLSEVLSAQNTYIFTDTATLLKALCKEAQPGDQVVVMSNSGFENMPERIAQSLGESVLRQEVRG